MKKTLFFLISILISATAFTQDNFHRIDSLAETFSKNKYKKPEDLVSALMKVCNNDTEKARIIFTWVAKNVKYDYDKLTSGNAGVSWKNNEKAAAYKKLANEIYKKGRGVCMDYAALFQELCNIAGLENEFIGGLTRNSAEGGSWGKHAWNAVKIDGKWQLLDVTWASGYIKKGKFKERFSPGYFMTKPDLFILNHFPEDEKWQLLDTPVSRKEFVKMPNINYASGDYNILDFEPRDGNVSGSKIQIKIQFKGSPPPIISLKVKSEPIPFKRIDGTDGWVTMDITRKKYGTIRVLAGEGEEERLTLLAEFE
jgi:hypothetical protein